MLIHKKTEMFKVLAAMFLVLSLAGGCTAMTGRTAGENIDDVTVTASVKATLVADQIANLTRIDVDTNRGVVSLNGVVESIDQRSRAEQLALRVDGVKHVLNNLQVR